MANRLLLASRVALAAAALSAALLASGQSAVPNGMGESFRQPPGALVAPGRAADLSILHTGDVVGFVDPCG